MKLSRKLLLGLGAGFVILHFCATWYAGLKAWDHDWAARLVDVMWFPGRLMDSGGSKFSNAALMLANSMLWGLAFGGFVALACWWMRRQRR